MSLQKQPSEHVDKSYEMFLFDDHLFVYNGLDLYGCGQMPNGEKLLAFTKINLGCQSKILNVSASLYNLFVMMKDGTTMCCGGKKFRQLKLGYGEKVGDFVKLSLQGIKVINGDRFHILAATNDGLFGCGVSFTKGFDIDKDVVEGFTRIDGISNVVRIYCGWYNNVVITTHEAIAFGTSFKKGMVKFAKDGIESVVCLSDYMMFLINGCVYTMNYGYGQQFVKINLYYDSSFTSMKYYYYSALFLHESNYVYWIDFDRRETTCTNEMINYVIKDKVCTFGFEKVLKYGDNIRNFWYCHGGFILEMDDGFYAIGSNDGGRFGFENDMVLCALQKMALPIC